MITHQRKLDLASLPNAELLPERFWQGDLTVASNNSYFKIHYFSPI